jgi:acetolactate synthase-1/2/3 large subunit
MYTDFLARADLVMAIGSSLTRTPFGPALPVGKTLVHSTNEASDINKDIATDHAVLGDAELVLEALIDEVGRQRHSRPQERLAALKSELASMKAAWLERWSEQLDSNEVPINQYRVVNELMRVVDRDNVILTHDSGSPRKQVLPFWQTTKAGSYIGWGKSTQLGYGLGVIMGAKLAAPEKTCINIMGDSAIGMTGMDLETAARNKIATLTIVFNNGVMASERDVMGVSNEKYKSICVGGNYAKLADALNVASERISKPDQIASAIKRAVAITEGGAPFLLEIMVKEGYDFSS